LCPGFRSEGFQSLKVATGQNETAAACSQFSGHGGTDAAGGTDYDNHGRIFSAHIF
jgi:hypothetical protein